MSAAGPYLYCKGMVTVYVVEQHRAVRQALVDWLGQLPQVRLLGSSGDMDTAQLEIQEHKAQVVLMEIKRADGQGLKLVGSLAALPQRPRILVLTSYASNGEREAVLQAGADSYVLKDIDTHELAALILSN